MSDEVRFRNPFRDRVRVHSVVGSPDKMIYVGQYDDRGRMYLKETGKVSIYQEIQSHADSVDINVLLARYRNGDTEVLSKVQGVYADITNMPKNLADAMNKVLAGEQAFMSLGTDVREKFNNNLGEWLASAGTAEWCEKMGLDYTEPAKKSKSGKVEPVFPSEPVPETVKEVVE